MTLKIKIKLDKSKWKHIFLLHMNWMVRISKTNISKESWVEKGHMYNQMNCNPTHCHTLNKKLQNMGYKLLKQHYSFVLLDLGGGFKDRNCVWESEIMTQSLRKWLKILYWYQKHRYSRYLFQWKKHLDHPSIMAATKAIVH